MKGVVKTEIETRIPEYVNDVFAALARAGHRGYLVGGSLRDLLRGETPHDYDMTTDATPEEMQTAFAAFRVIPTGIRHGTLTVLSAGNPVEVTTHRVDGAYLDSRRPESVSFTCELTDDLSRRDFTVNAMAWSAETGLVDPFGGQEDLARGVIRAVGDPAARFGEDALRILRAFRFSAQLDFDIDDATLAGAAEMREGLARISAERIFAETERLLRAPAVVRGLTALFAAKCENYVFFDTVPPHNRIGGLPLLPAEAPIRAAALLCDADPARVRELCHVHWHTSNVFAEEVTEILAALTVPLPRDAYEARRFVCTHFRGWQGALAVREIGGEAVGEARELANRVFRDRTAVEVRRLVVNGRELQEETGVRPAATAELLRRLQDFVWHDPTRNKRAVLLAEAKKICEKERDLL